jgi:hypothetical protein
LKERERERERKIETFRVEESSKKVRDLLGWKNWTREREKQTFRVEILNKIARARERERGGEREREREKQTFWVEILNVQLMLLKRTFQTRQVDNRQTSQIDRQRKTFWVEQISKVFYNRFRLNQTGRYKLTEREREKKKHFGLNEQVLKGRIQRQLPIKRDRSRKTERPRERETRTLKER